jgi:hypothetical protein
MSGHPNNTPLDAIKFRNAYMETLNLQAKINQANLDANKIYKKTGTTPSENTDTRTIEEKYADLEKLKLGIRKSLSGFADSRTAEAISQELETLGADDLLFASNNMANIIEILKKHYANGLANPEQFFETYDKYKAKIDETKGVGDVGNVSLMRNIQLILDNMVGRPELADIADLINRSAVSNTTASNQTLTELKTLLALLPTGADIEAINAKSDPILRAEILADLQMVLSQLPNKAELQSELNTLSVAIRTGDKAFQMETIELIKGLITLNPEAQEILADVMRQLESRYKKRSIGFEYLNPTGNLLALDKAQLVEYARNLKRLSAIGEQSPFDVYSAKEIEGLKKPDLQKFIQQNDGWIRSKFGMDIPTSIGKATKGVGIRGCGITPREHKVSYRIRPDQVDFTSGIDRMPKYIKFGRYLLHKPKLEDNIIKITTNSGAGITGFKPERVSRHFGGVIKKIVSGLNPTYEEIGGLTDDEKDYLYKLAKKSQILDRLSIPAPNKSKDDKLSDRFDILKGEIQAGNNSTELIKEFKTLILNLSNKDLLPKSQAKDILMDLVSMGY